jgi:hypothetical protein
MIKSKAGSEHILININFNGFSCFIFNRVKHIYFIKTYINIRIMCKAEVKLIFFIKISKKEV